MATVNPVAGGTFWRGDEGYEAARRGHMWNSRVPARYPDVVVEARNEDDVVAAVRLARQRGLKIAVRSGGHSWAAAFLRDGGMLIDVSRMCAFRVDAEARTARLQPGLKGTDLNRALRQHELFFPSGHCMTVGLGGFLLQGGFGWNSRLWGPACASVTAIEVVTADGELVAADANRNADLFWAAHGAGPGFFGVVTRFDVRLQPRPKQMMKSDYLYPIEALDDVLRWVRSVQPSLARTMECMVFVRRDIFDHPGPGALVTAPVLAGSRDEAVEALAMLESCPVLGKAVKRDVNIVTEFDELLQGGEDLLYPRQRRYASDNMWTSAPAEALLPGMRSITASLPNAPSHMMWMLWGPPQTLPDMAFSMEDDLYIALYSVWADEAEDARHQAWVTDHMRSLEPFASGIQLADENLAARPFRFMADANFHRLQAIRSKRDPDGLFHSYMGLPAGLTGASDPNRAGRFQPARSIAAAS
jgi:FAD/FMN-containing dehydrogenase